MELSSLPILLFALLLFNWIGAYQTAMVWSALECFPKTNGMMKQALSIWWWIWAVLSSVIAWFFLERYRQELFVIDLIFTTLAFSGVWLMTYKKRHEIPFQKVENQSGNKKMVWQACKKHKLLVLGIAGLYTAMYIPLLIMPLYFEHRQLQTIQLTALQMLVNTIWWLFLQYLLAAYRRPW